MAVLVTSGRTAVTMSVANQPIHLAWGSGDSGWDTTPVAEPMAATALVAEIGRRAPNTVEFVTPDMAGVIVLADGSKYAVSGFPTRYLHVVFEFDTEDASTSQIRELGVFIGTVIKSSVSTGQRYYQPVDILTPGTLLALQRVPKIQRSPETRPAFEFVLTF